MSSATFVGPTNVGMEKMPSYGAWANLPPMCLQLFEAKTKKGLSFEDIGKKMGKNEVWVSCLFFGQAKPLKEDVEALSEILGIRKEYIMQEFGEGYMPDRGVGKLVPTDPVLYRFYEVLQVFGYPIKSIIMEKFGDGIMSAIDFTLDIDKVPDPKGDRVKVTMNGKFLPYKRF